MSLSKYPTFGMDSYTVFCQKIDPEIFGKNSIVLSSNMIFSVRNFFVVISN